MPYPILSLPYGLQQRLRTLAIKKEAYQLQIAAGLHKHNLNPMLKVTTHPTGTIFYLTNDNGNIVLSTTLNTPTYVPLDWGNENEMIAINSTLFIGYFSLTDYNHPIFDHLLIECNSINYFFGCNLNAQIFEKLKPRVNSKMVTSLFGMSCSPDLKLNVILDTFENLESLTFYRSNYAYKDWIQDLLSVEKRSNLGNLFFGGDFEDLFSFNPQQLKQLFEAFPSSFNLTLACFEIPDGAEEKVRSMLGPHFDEYDGDHEEGVLCVRLETSPLFKTKNMLFQIGRPTDNSPPYLRQA